MTPEHEAFNRWTVIFSVECIAPGQFVGRAIGLEGVAEVIAATESSCRAQLKLDVQNAIMAGPKFRNNVMDRWDFDADGKPVERDE